MEKAFADVSQSIELNRSMPLAYILRGSTYRDQGEFSAAVTGSSRAIQLNSRSYSGYGGRAAAYAGLGDFAKSAGTSKRQWRSSRQKTTWSG